MSFDGSVPAEFKQTAIGPIPEDWEVVAFGDHFTFQNGVNADKKAYGRGVRFANVLEVITHTHLSADHIPGQVQLGPAQVSVFSVKQGDILFNRTSETQDEVGLASVYVGDEPVVFGGFVIRGQPISDAFDPVYTGYGFRAPIVRAQIISKGQGAVRANIGQSELRTTWLPLPPLSEQRAIAEALSDVDGLIAQMEALVAKKQGLKQAAAQTLLTGQTRLPGFSDNWREVKLHDLAEIVSGGTPSSGKAEYWNGGIPWCTPTDITECEGNFLRATPRTISEAGLAASAATVLPAGTILLCSRATLGEARIAAVPMTTNQGFKSLIAKPETNNFFLYFLIGTLKSRMVELASGSTFLEVSKRDLGSIEILVPHTSEEQAAIAAVLSDMDAEIEALEAQLEKTHYLKSGMMQDLLTGRVRLTRTGERRAA